MVELVHEYASNPFLLFAFLIVIAWIWEDASVISGALVATENVISVPLAITAAFIGICSGDLALFYLGRLGVRSRRVRAWILLNPKSRALRRRFRAHTFSNILLIRFVPGLRTLGFTLCGLWLIPMKRFVLAMSAAGVIWIAVVFTLIYQLGSSSWLASSPWKWGLIALAAVLLLVNNFVNFNSNIKSNRIKPLEE